MYLPFPLLCIVTHVVYHTLTKMRIYQTFWPHAASLHNTYNMFQIYGDLEAFVYTFQFFYEIVDGDRLVDNRIWVM